MLDARGFESGTVNAHLGTRWRRRMNTLGYRVMHRQTRLKMHALMQVDITHHCAQSLNRARHLAYHSARYYTAAYICICTPPPLFTMKAHLIHYSQFCYSYMRLGLPSHLIIYTII
jgi:hypothetical protein